MYENNYPNSYHNDTDTTNTVNNTYSQDSSRSHYETGGSFTNQSFGNGGYKGAAQGNFTGMNTSGIYGSSNKKQKKGTAGKLAIAVSCGLFFGIFAGLGFQALDSAMDFVKKKY